MAAVKPSVSTVMPRGRERIFGEIERKAVSVVKLEGVSPGRRSPFLKPLRGFVQQLEAARQRLAEADFLQFQGFGVSGSARLSSG